MRSLALPLILLGIVSPFLNAAEPARPTPIHAPAIVGIYADVRLPLTPVTPAMASIPFVTKLPMTNLAPAKIFPNLCIYRYRVGTPSAECQAYIDQGLGFYYSYVWMEAARSFETALRYDPNCAFAWFYLSRAIEKWGKGKGNEALERAKTLMSRASDREQLLIRSRLEEKGMIGDTKPEDRVKKAQATLDELITLYDDDQEAWFARAQITPGTSAIPYYKALLRINPLHPGATHEMVHFYENFRRPALGFPYANAYIQSSPGIPHPHHMQAHLATRLGKWSRSSDLSTRAIELERAYHQYQNVQPKDDFQFSHHLEILTLSLVHDGRFAEARKIKAEAQKAGYQQEMPWYRLHRYEGDTKAAMEIVEKLRKRDKSNGAYLAALVYLDLNDLPAAGREIDTLRHTMQTKRNDRKIELRFWEAQGRYLCRTGAPDEGLKLLERAVQKTINDFGHHSWGNGAYYMEIWGEEALRSGRVKQAEEAFLEALAHDPGSVRAALGMQMLCERLGRHDEAERFASLTSKCWMRADADAFARLRREYALYAQGIAPMPTEVSAR